MNAAARIARNPIGWALLVVAAAILLFSTFAVVPETQQALVVRLGQPVYVVNGYVPNQRFGETGAGLIARIPFIDDIVRIDKRVLDFDMEKQSVLSTDQLRLEVSAYARYRIVDPLRMYRVARDENRVGDALRPILGSSLRNELGRRDFAVLLSPERGRVMSNIRAQLNFVAGQYGAEIVDVRIKRADLPDGTPLDSAFQRMRTARQQEALTIQAQGQKAAQIIRADADALASRVYADSFGKDADFYDFYRAMQSYRYTFGSAGNPTPGSSTSMVLSPNNEYLRQFRGGGK